MSMPYVSFDPRGSMNPVFALRTGMWCLNDKSIEIARFLEAFLRPGHRWLIRARSRAAFACWQKKRYDEACACYEKILEAFSKEGIREGIGHARVWSMLGYVCYLKGDLDRAASLYESSLALYEKYLGKDHDILVAVLHNLSVALCQRGDLQRAEVLNNRAMRITNGDSTEVPNYTLGGGICALDLEPVKTYPSWKGRSFTQASLYQQRAEILREMGRTDEAQEWEQHCDELSMRTMAEW